MQLISTRIAKGSCFR